ncbi:MAG: hypothetical protein ABR591_10545 [Candidatus Velthaea sp.]
MIRFAAVTLALALAGPLSVFAAIPSGAPIDGIPCQAMEFATMHIHPHLTVVDHGKPVPIPEDVGRPAFAQCLYWLHTHTPDGIIHIESPQVRAFTLGQFMDIWGEPLTRTNVAGAKPRKGETVKVYVQRRPYAGDPRKIEFAQHLDIDIVVGPPYPPPPPFTAWNGN